MKASMQFGWAPKPLGDLVDVLDRFRKPITKTDREAGPFPYYGATGVLDHVSGYLFDEPLVLIGEDGAKWEAGANSAFAIEGKTWVNNHAHVLRPHRDRLLDDWLIYYLNGADLTPFISGMTVPKLNQGRLLEIPIPLPPLEEQERIVAILDEALEGLDRARANAEANLQNARELFESALGAGLAREAIGWRTAELKDLVEADCTLSYGIVQPGEEYAGGLPIIRPTDLGEREIGLSGLKRIDPAFASGYARTSLKGRDILLCVRGSTGVVAMASEELAGANVTRGIVPIRFNPKILKQRLGYFQFLSGPVQSQIRAGTYGAALMQINIRDLRLIKMLVPPLDQQDTVLERLEDFSEQIDRTVLHYQLKLQKIIELRQSLMHKAFAGELT